MICKVCNEYYTEEDYTDRKDLQPDMCPSCFYFGDASKTGEDDLCPSVEEELEDEESKEEDRGDVLIPSKFGKKVLGQSDEEDDDEDIIPADDDLDDPI